jgi:hypothetical protein
VIQTTYTVLFGGLPFKYTNTIALTGGVPALDT